MGTKFILSDQVLSQGLIFLTLFDKFLQLGFILLLPCCSLFSGFSSFLKEQMDFLHRGDQVTRLPIGQEFPILCYLGFSFN